MHFIFTCIIFFTVPVIFAEDSRSVSHLVFVILNQNEPNHLKAAEDLRGRILLDSSTHSGLNSSVFIATSDFPKIYAWTYFPLFQRLSRIDADWLIFLRDNSGLNFERLLLDLKGYRWDKCVFLGRGLEDSQRTIIHHFEDVDENDPLLYPDYRTGIILSREAVKRFSSGWIHYKEKPNFSIDAQHELAKFAHKVHVSLINLPSLCDVEDLKESCSIWTVQTDCQKAAITAAISKEDQEGIHFAVKTCSHLSPERLPILRRTWLPETISAKLYSDTTNHNLGTTSLGIPNVERGHCTKTLAIIRHAAKISGLKWLVVADDDTLLSVKRLVKFLTCYDYENGVAIGERYGFNTVDDDDDSRGYEYLTGGSSFVLSHRAVSDLAAPGGCVCPSDDTPDDMFLGVCLKRLQIPIVHSGRFHQARPEDYSAGYLEHSLPISFHKFWLVDPLDVYKVQLEEHWDDVNDHFSHAEF